MQEPGFRFQPHLFRFRSLICFLKSLQQDRKHRSLFTIIWQTKEIKHFLLNFLIVLLYNLPAGVAFYSDGCILSGRTLRNNAATDADPIRIKEVKIWLLKKD